MHFPLSVLGRSMLAGAAAAAALAATAQLAFANVGLTQVSSDPFTNSASQHRSEVEPDTVTNGSTIVGTFQTGRIFGGGSADIGFVTSTNRGASWTHGFLPGITASMGGPYAAASDAAVAFDPRHNAWLISSLALSGPGGTAVLTSRSTDGGLTWSRPVTVTTGDLDKNWITCDSTPSSRFFGSCYTEYDIPGAGDALRMQTSTDGGLTWGPPRPTADGAHGIGGQPLVQPSGRVVVPYAGGAGMRSFQSTDGGLTWSASVALAGARHHGERGSIRTPNLPSATVDGAGTVYLAWADCRFRTGCRANDIVISRSADGVSWSAPVRVPIDAVTSAADHFIPGIGADRSAAGTGRLGLTYYFYPQTRCTAATCQLDVGFISSVNGGTTWSAATQVAGPMTLSWLPNTSQGRMFGDYIGTAVLPAGAAFPVLPVAAAPSGGLLNLAMDVPTAGLPVVGGPHRADLPASSSFMPAPEAPTTAN
jgi:hypothetical protein